MKVKVNAGGVGLMVLVIVLLLFADTVYYNFAPKAVHADNYRCKANLASLASALESYSHESEGAYPENLEDLVPKYLQRIPETTPSHRNAQYGSTYKTGATGYNKDAKHPHYFTISCPDFKAHERIDSRPQFDSVRGSF